MLTIAAQCLRPRAGAGSVGPLENICPCQSEASAFDQRLERRY